MRNSSVRPSRLASPAWEPTTKTISHANASTTIVRNAVARLDGVCRIPAFARIAVTPAKKADPAAYSNHMGTP